MSTMESIAADVAAMVDALSKAQRATAAADDATQRIAARAAGSGFAGVAQNLSRLREAIREIHTGLAAVTGLVGEASTAVAAVPAQATVQQTAAVLGPVTQTLDNVHGQLGVVLERITKAQQLAGAVLQGGQPGPMLARLDVIRQILLTVVQRTNQASDTVKTVGAEALRTGDQGN